MIDPLPVGMAASALSSLLTTLWHEWAFRHRQVKQHREACRHVWGDQFEVGHATPLWPQRFYAARCLACGETQHRNEDGTVYEPRDEREPTGR